MIKLIIISIVGLLLLTQKLVSTKLPYEFQYLHWHLTLLLSLVGVSFVLMLQISYKEYFKKFASFLIFDISAYALFDYIIRVSLQDNPFSIIDYLPIFSSLGLSAVFIRSYINFFIKSSDKYVRNNSYLVYKYPKSIWGVLSTIYTAPYGHCFLVIDNKKFYYRKGILTEVIFDAKKQQNNLIYKKINNVEPIEAQRLVGKKWSIFNNCFSTFSRFK